MSEFDPSKFERTAQPDDSEIASAFVSLICVTILSILLGIKTYNVQFKYLSCSRWLILALYVFSMAFTISATVFISTNNGNYMSCFFSEMSCDLFYSGTKIIIYFWLVEKVWVVSASREQRWKTKSYRIHMLLMTPYVGILTLMFTFHIAEIQETGVCIIGLELVASIPLLLYDFIFNTYMTILFIKPLMKSEDGTKLGWKASKLHDVARRTLVASVVALLVSFANILTLTLFNGRERGVVCLTCCTVDVTINVITIHWVTGNRSKKTKKGQKNTSTSVRNEGSTEDPENILSADAEVHNFKNHYYINQNTPSYELDYYNNHAQIDEDLKSSRPSSLQESQSSQKTLTKK